MKGRSAFLLLGALLVSCGDAPSSSPGRSGAAVPEAAVVDDDAGTVIPDAASEAAPEAAPELLDASGDAATRLDASGDAATQLDASGDAATQLDASGDAASQLDAGSDADGDASSLEAPSSRPDYIHLSETGLYVDAATRTPAATVRAFEPTYKLWSDDLTKRRWMALPPGAPIDTGDMDHWVFPVGTKVWKEFSLNSVVLETRLVERYGTGPEDYWMGSFAWNGEQTDAVFVPNGVVDVLDTFHDIPPAKDCGACHRGEVGRVLGFSALQLSRPPDGSGSTLRELVAMNLLSAPPVGVVDFDVPGDATTRTALGYLHANCGHCHNLHGTAWPDTQMVLRLDVEERDLAATKLAATSFDKALTYWRGGAIAVRLSPGHPETSAIYARMNLRGKDQMPPLATELLDATGLAAVRDWIAALSPSAAPM